MKSGGPIRRRTPLRADGTQRKRPSHKNALWRKSSADVASRSGGWCEANWPGVCEPGRHRADHVHHVILRAQGGPDEAWNLMHLCQPVHHHAHDVDRAGAEERGIIRSRPPGMLR